ncbi:EI24 domain-containing protein [Marinactinospora rubrisoli]|uniref:EI24 domain-containing protein n=1 Tax=Marinactinospora rubrisoli TaxID=2715399 RepID=A0ABW2KCY2_9ACTN
MTNPVREVLTGVGALLQGFGLILRRPKLFLLGAIPPLITSVLFVIALVLLIANAPELVAWMTPFADGWDEVWRTTLRVAFGIALVAGMVLVMVVGFTGFTLAFGFPLYDKIAEDVEEELGHAPPATDEPLARSMLRALRQSLALMLISAAVGILLFAAGFIPVAGQTVIPVIAALFGGWMLCIELVGSAFDRRGMHRLADRRAHMGRYRLRSLGFSVPAYLLLAIPFVAVIVFPAATAGGTILARQLLAGAPGQPTPPLVDGAPRPPMGE